MTTRLRVKGYGGWFNPQWALNENDPAAVLSYSQGDLLIKSNAEGWIRSVDGDYPYSTGYYIPGTFNDLAWISPNFYPLRLSTKNSAGNYVLNAYLANTDYCNIIELGYRRYDVTAGVVTPIIYRYQYIEGDNKFYIPSYTIDFDRDFTPSHAINQNRSDVKRMVNWFVFDTRAARKLSKGNVVGFDLSFSMMMVGDMAVTAGALGEGGTITNQYALEQYQYAREWFSANIYDEVTRLGITGTGLNGSDDYEFSAPDLITFPETVPLQAVTWKLEEGKSDFEWHYDSFGYPMGSYSSFLTGGSYVNGEYTLGAGSDTPYPYYTVKNIRIPISTFAGLVPDTIRLNIQSDQIEGLNHSSPLYDHTGTGINMHTVFKDITLKLVYG